MQKVIVFLSQNQVQYHGLIHCECKNIQKEIKSKIETKLQDNARFSVDEYTQFVAVDPWTSTETLSVFIV